MVNYMHIIKDLAVVSCGGCFGYYCVYLNKVIGSSMEPTYNDGDYLISLHPKVYELITTLNIFDSNHDYLKNKTATIFIKRPLNSSYEYSESKAIDSFDENYMINTNMQDTLSDTEMVLYCKRILDIDYNQILVNNEIQNGSTKLWIEGDNKPYSHDSRNFGFVPIEQLKGIVIGRVWPLNIL